MGGAEGPDDVPTNDLPTGKHTQTNTQACDCVTDSQTDHQLGERRGLGTNTERRGSSMNDRQREIVVEVVG